MSPGGADQLTDPDPVVLLWPAGPEDGSAATVRVVLASTTVDTRVMLAGGGISDPLLEAVHASARARVTVLDHVGDGGFAATLNEAIRTSGRSDLVVLAGGWVLPEGWLEGLRRAALCDDNVAAAFPLVLGDGASLFTGLDISGPGPPAESTPVSDVPAAEPARAPGPVHPRIWAPPAAFAYLRRATLELLGGADPTFAHPATVLADLAARALASGLSCTLADDVWVEPQGDGALPAPDAELRALSERHAWIDPARQDTAAAEVGPLRRSLIAVRAARNRVSVTIDARNLGSSFGGTQTYTAALIRALARSGRVSVRTVVTDEAAARASRAQFEDCDVEIVTYEQALAGIARTDLVHRPQQVFTPHDLALLRLLGERLIISHLDLIAYRSPSCHRSADDWRSYRRATRLALGAADRVVFLSEHGRREAIAEELIEAGRTAVVGIGIEDADGEEVRRPEGVPAGRPFVVMIGADYMHKNRVFAFSLVAELRRRHGWDGVLVLAGPHVTYGSSAAPEADLLSARPELAAHVLDLGPVNEAEKRWLLRHAQALLCPSTYEGYGLTPLEAAAEGLPCIYPALTSLVDVLGREAATIVPWDPVASAHAAIVLLSPGAERDRHLALLAEALGRCAWGSIVDHLCQVYGDAIQSPYRASTPRAWEELEREELMVQLYVNYQDLEARIAHGLPLIDRDGLLTRAEQRGLMRIASRRWLRGPVLGPIGLLGDLGTDGD